MSATVFKQITADQPSSHMTTLAEGGNVSDNFSLLHVTAHRDLVAGISSELFFNTNCQSSNDIKVLLPVLQIVASVL